MKTLTVAIFTFLLVSAVFAGSEKYDFKQFINKEKDVTILQVYDCKNTELYFYTWLNPERISFSKYVQTKAVMNRLIKMFGITDKIDGKKYDDYMFELMEKQEFTIEKIKMQECKQT